MKVLVLASATALTIALACVPASARIGMAPTASSQDDTLIQVRGGGHGYGHHGWHRGRGHHYGWHRGRGHHYGWYRGRGHRMHRH